MHARPAELETGTLYFRGECIRYPCRFSEQTNYPAPLLNLELVPDANSVEKRSGRSAPGSVKSASHKMLSSQLASSTPGSGCRFSLQWGDQGLLAFDPGAYQTEPSLTKFAEACAKF
jgi:hypothetical protein